MSNHQMEQQVQANQQKLREAEVHTRLETLQTWNAQAGPELKAEREAHQERLVRHQQELNAELQANAQQQLPQAQAQAAAPGAPVQVHTDAEQTYKQRKAQAKKLKEAQDHTNHNGTLETYELKEQTAALLKGQDNSRAPYLKEAKEKEVDVRILKAFCEGYRKGRLGRPATAEDRARKERDQAFLEDYLSKDLQRRQPHLERFKQELMEFPVTQDTISDANLVKNAARIKQITDWGVYYANIMTDPINAPYFNALPPEELAVLRRKLDLLTKLGGYFDSKAKTMYVQTSMGEYTDTVTPEIRMMAEIARGELVENMQSMTTDCRNAVEQSVTQRAERERNIFLYPVQEALRSMWRHEEGGHSIEFSQPAFREVYDQMRALRELIASEPTVYRANRAMIDSLYQDAYRTMDLYNDLKMEEQLYLGVAGKYDAGGSFMERTKKAAAVKKVREYQEQFQAYTQRVEAITNALNFCLKEEALTAEGRSILDELGLTRQTEGLIRLRSILRKVRPGNAADGGNPDAAANGGNADVGANDGNADAAPQE